MSTTTISNYSVLRNVHIPHSNFATFDLQLPLSSTEHNLSGRCILFLPDDMELYIFSFLHSKDLMTCHLVSMDFNELSSSNWVWEQIKNREFPVGLGLVKQISWKTTWQIQKWWYKEQGKKGQGGLNCLR